MAEQGCSSSVFRNQLAKLLAIFVLMIAHPSTVTNSLGQVSRTARLASLNESDAPRSEDRLQMRLRLTWGGGTDQTWAGKLRVTQGSLSKVAPLGLTPDSPGSVRLAGGELLIQQWMPVNYGGADVSIEGTSQTRIHLTLSSTQNPDFQIEKTISLEELIAHPVTGDIDALGNQYSISRVPGDRLRVTFSRDHLVFRPGERFQFDLQPNLTGLATRTATGRIKVVAASPKGFGSGRYSSVKPVSFEMGERGSAVGVPVDVVVPQQEGVYNIEMELEPVWYQTSLNSLKHVIRRRIQILVLNDAPILDSENKLWRQVSLADPVEPDPGSLASWSRFAGRSKVPYGNELRSPIEVGGESMMQIQPGGWQAIPLEMARLNKPHRIEIEYVSGESLAVGISLLEPDSKGQVPLYGCDSGLFLPKSLVGAEEKGKIELHRMTIWPQTKTPFLLIANRHRDQPVTIGKIRVFAGPDRLDSHPVAPIREGNRPTRKMMAFYETTLFSDNFGSSQKVDATSESFDDWTVFYQGADRLVQYLKANSYRGAFLTVVSDGSSIYPSRLLNPSPQHDNGAFFELGQDPIRKDILEMLFRMFEREGLLLVPTLALTSPLPEVEATRNRQRTPDFELVDLNQNHHVPTFGGELPIYNPLDRKVQHAVNRVVEELADRYRVHSAFDGIAVICRPDTYTLLPGRQWGNDATTVQQFFQTQNDLVNELGATPDQWSDVQRVLLGSHRDSWVQWRAARMATWYGDLASTLRRSLPKGTLYLAAVDLYRNEEISSALSPSLHGSSDYEQLMLQIGFSRDLVADPNHRGDHPGLVFLNPHRLAPDQSFAAQRVDWHVEHSKQVQQYFAHSDYAADLFTHRIAWAHFEQLQSQGVFRNQLSPLMRLQQMTPAGQFNRRRFVQSIKNRDTRMLVDGGAMIVTGQEEAVSDLMSVFGRLPDVPFADVESSRYANANTLPLAIRQYQSGNETFFYCVNASPWPIEVLLQGTFSESGDPPRIESLSRARFTLEATDATTDDSAADPKKDAQWFVRVPPFGLVGGHSIDRGFSLTDYRFNLPENAENDLRKRVYSLQSKLNKSRAPRPLSAISNSSFEIAEQPTLSDWDIGASSTGSVRLESESPIDGAPAHLGRVSMVMSNDGTRPVWVRSNLFDAPETGRLSISVWLRTDDPSNQPPLRLAIEGQSNGASYYRFGSVGSLSPDPETNQLESRWKRFAVHFDDLPVTGLSDVRIGFDLMGPGQVFVDEIQVFDRWFDENDAKAITQLLASTGPLLSRQETYDSCRLLLEGYWARFLDEYFATEDPASKAPDRHDPSPIRSDVAPGADRQAKVIEPELEKRSLMFRRFRNLVPQRKTIR